MLLWMFGLVVVPILIAVPIVWLIARVDPTPRDDEPARSEGL